MTKKLKKIWSTDGQTEVVTLRKSFFGANVLNIYSYVQLLDF